MLSSLKVEEIIKVVFPTKSDTFVKSLVQCAIDICDGNSESINIIQLMTKVSYYNTVVVNYI